MSLESQKDRIIQLNEWVADLKSDSDGINLFKLKNVVKNILVALDSLSGALLYVTTLDELEEYKKANSEDINRLFDYMKSNFDDNGDDIKENFKMLEAKHQYLLERLDRSETRINELFSYKTSDTSEKILVGLNDKVEKSIRKSREFEERLYKIEKRIQEKAEGHYSTGVSSESK